MFVWLQALLFVPIIYVMIGFTPVWEKALYYAFMFLCSISFYTIFGQFMVYVTPSQQIAQVRARLSPSGHAVDCVSPAARLAHGTTADANPEPLRALVAFSQGLSFSMHAPQYAPPACSH